MLAAGVGRMDACRALRDRPIVAGPAAARRSVPATPSWKKSP
jgi:hypothetical protein